MSRLPTPVEVTRRSIQFERRALAPAFGIRAAAVIAAPIVIGVAVGRPDDGAWFALGALYAAFAEHDGPRRERLRGIAIAILAAAVSTGIGGALLPNAILLQIVVVGLWGTAAALAVARGPAVAGVAVVAPFALLGSAEIAAAGYTPLLLTFAVLVGGALQLAVAALWPGSAPNEGIALEPPSRASARRHAVRMGIALSIGTAMYTSAGLKLGPWIAVTILFVLKPTTAGTATKTFQRFSGTFIGVAIATAVVAIAGASYPILIVICAIGFGVNFSTRRAQYTIASGGISAATVALFAVTGLPETDVAFARVVDTLVGAAIAAATIIAIPEPRPTTDS